MPGQWLYTWVFIAIKTVETFSNNFQNSSNHIFINLFCNSFVFYLSVHIALLISNYRIAS